MSAGTDRPVASVAGRLRGSVFAIFSLLRRLDRSRSRLGLGWPCTNHARSCPKILESHSSSVPDSERIKSENESGGVGWTCPALVARQARGFFTCVCAGVLFRGMNLAAGTESSISAPARSGPSARREPGRVRDQATRTGQALNSESPARLHRRGRVGILQR